MPPLKWGVLGCGDVAEYKRDLRSTQCYLGALTKMRMLNGMRDPKLNHLQSVKLRDIWPDEAKDFTPWLSKPENLAHLAEALNMELKFVAQEKDVGQFRADVLCQNTADSSRVLIENQLEETNHTHLGQILTYTAGVDAATIIWISERFTDEHQAALNWLNKNTPEHFQFFGVVIRAWRAQNSQPRASFAVVSAPDSWNGQVMQHAIEVSTPREQQERFWNEFREYLSDRGSPLRPSKMAPRSYLTFSLGFSGFKLSAMRHVKNQHIGVRLYISGQNATAHYRLFAAQREAIESEIGEPLEWKETFGRNPSQVTLRKGDTDLTNEAEWPHQHTWLATTLERFTAVFVPRLQGLNAPDKAPEEEENN